MSPVRNIRSIGRAKPIPVHIWIPPTYGAKYKIEITRSDGSTTDNVTDIIYEGEVVDGVTDTIGRFIFTIDNSSETYTGAWTGNETIKIYIDYATSATTLRFRGVIEKVSYRDNKIKINGRSESLKLLDVSVTKSYTNIETSVILKDIFDSYATDFTYTNVETSTTNITVNWNQKSFWGCVNELCNAAGFDCYIDSSLDCHYFSSGSRSNTTEAVVHGSNLFEVGDFADDLSAIKNKVIVYGAEIGGLPLFKTAKNDSSISTYGTKELIINDTNVKTETQCQERADYELALGLNPQTVGEVVGMGLATIQPGERIRISAPSSNLPPAYRKIISYTHRFKGFMKTTLVIEKESKKISQLFKDRLVKEQEIIEIQNPNDLDYSWNFDFSTDTGSHTNTEIVDGRLKLSSGQTSGTWTSEYLNLDEDLSAVESRINGSNLANTEIWISTDGGITFKQISGPGTQTKYFKVGKSIQLRVDLLSPKENVEVTGLALLYSQ